MVVWLRRFDIPLFYKIFSHRPKGNNALEYLYFEDEKFKVSLSHHMYSMYYVVSL